MFRKSSHTKTEWFDGRHRFERWHRDNTVYFITSKTRGGLPVFTTDTTTSIFWDRFDHYRERYGFVPWVTTPMNNHYHTLGYLKVGENLGPMMQKFHGSVAKLVNDTLPKRHLPFWRTAGNKDYFDGCIRDVLQAQRAYRYTLQRAVRARRVRDWRDYPHTRVNVPCDRAVARALDLDAFLDDLPYARYDRHRATKRHGRLSDHAP